MKTSELEGAELDLWVARALGYRLYAETTGYSICNDDEFIGRVSGGRCER